MKNHLVSLLWTWKFKGHTRSMRCRGFFPSQNLYKISSLTLYSTVSFFFFWLPYPTPKRNKSNKTNKTWIKSHFNTPKAKTWKRKRFPVLLMGADKQGKVIYVHKNAKSKKVRNGLRVLNLQPNLSLSLSLSLSCTACILGLFQKFFLPPLWIFTQNIEYSHRILNIT